MSIVNIRNIELVNNPARFQDEYHFRIKFEAMAPLAEDLDWRLIYVGSAKSEEYDQELDSCMVGPIPAGVNAFDFEAPAPQPNLLPPDEILGVTVIIVSASYREKEFVRVGYYVNTYYDDEEMNAQVEKDAEEKRSRPIVWEKLMRNVLIEKPKVTRFQNPWDSGAPSFGGDANAVEISSGGSNYMLESAPLPPPVTKASAQATNEQNDGMDVDMGIAA